jgi:hypothetical protein
MQGSEGAPPLPPKGVLGRTLQAVSGLGSAAVSLTPAWAKSGLKHLVCNIADVVAPPLPPENAHVTVEEQISEQLSSISTILQQQQLNDGSDQATHAKLAIQYQLTRISQVLDERKRRTSCSDDVVVAASITSSSSSSSSISSSSDNDGTGFTTHIFLLHTSSTFFLSHYASLWRPCSASDRRHVATSVFTNSSRQAQRTCCYTLSRHSCGYTR